MTRYESLLIELGESYIGAITPSTQSMLRILFMSVVNFTAFFFVIRMVAGAFQVTVSPVLLMV